MHMPDALLYTLKPWLLALLLPPAPGLLLAALGGLCLRRRAVGRSLLAVGLLYVWLSCTDWFGCTLQRWLLDVPPPLGRAEMEMLAKRSDTAVLVLGGGSVVRAPEYGMGPDLNGLSMERLRYGVWLARALQAPLAFSGGIASSDDPGRVAEAVLAERIAAEQFGLPLRWSESSSRNTRENAQLSVPMLKAAGIKQLVLVTHAMHLPRALRAFRAVAPADMELIPAGVDDRAAGPWNWGDFLPGSPGFRRNRYVWVEFLGLLSGH